MAVAYTNCFGIFAITFFKIAFSFHTFNIFFFLLFSLFRSRPFNFFFFFLTTGRTFGLFCHCSLRYCTGNSTALFHLRYLGLTYYYLFLFLPAFILAHQLHFATFTNTLLLVTMNLCNLLHYVLLCGLLPFFLPSAKFSIISGYYISANTFCDTLENHQVLFYHLCLAVLVHLNQHSHLDRIYYSTKRVISCFVI